MKKPLPIILLVLTSTFLISLANADMAKVIKRFDSCDYFISAGTKGFYVFEWFGGYDPDEGDIIAGDLNSYGMKTVTYPSMDREGKL